MASISSSSICYPKSVSFIKCLMDVCIYGDILDTILITDKMLVHFKLSKSGQILRVDKTGFPRPSHNYACECPIIPRIMPSKLVI